MLGKETIDTYNTGESRGTGNLPLAQLSKIGERADEPGRTGRHGRRQVHPCSCAVCGRFLSDKYDITKHPNFKYTADADKQNTLLTLKRFCRPRLKLKPNEVCDVYEVDTKGA